MSVIILKNLKKVLIETYWNVKKEKGKLTERINKVLIETYWNVKTGTEPERLMDTGINRNILECKGL